MAQVVVVHRGMDLPSDQTVPQFTVSHGGVHIEHIHVSCHADIPKTEDLLCAAGAGIWGQIHTLWIVSVCGRSTGSSGSSPESVCRCMQCRGLLLVQHLMSLSVVGDIDPG